MDLKIDPEQVEKFLAEKVLESGLGKKIKEAVDKELEQLGRSSWSHGQGAISMAIKQEVQDVARSLLQEEFRPLIEEKIRELLTAEALSEAVEKLVRNLLRDW